MAGASMRITSVARLIAGLSVIAACVAPTVSQDTCPTGQVLVADGGSWVCAPFPSGTTGPTGSAGAMGVVGATGQPGTMGAEGVTGVTGETGSTGATGSIGTTGSVGST